MQGIHFMSFSLQKANFWKRISAFIFDAILAFCLILGVGIGVSFLLDYDTKVDTLKAVRTEIETQFEFDKYGLSFDLSEEEYKKLDDATKQIYDDANKAFLQDERTGASFRELMLLAILNVAVSVFVADLVIYFVVPILFKNGQTLGKKCFGLAVIRSSGVKVSKPILLIRSMIGRFAMETMVPLTIVSMILLGMLGAVGIITLVLFAGLEIGVFLATKTNSCIHDLVSDTVVVDMSSQQIFETVEERIAYDEEQAAIKAAEAENGGRPVATGVFAPKAAEEPVFTATPISQAEASEIQTAQLAQVVETAENTQNAETAPVPAETQTESQAQSEPEKDEKENA